MPEPEEGAAFFEPIRFDVGMVPPRTMGLETGMLTRGYNLRGLGQFMADSAASEPSPAPAPSAPSSVPVVASAVPPSTSPSADHVPWLFGIGAAIGGFILFSRKRKR
jgi:hypothetical protein